MAICYSAYGKPSLCFVSNSMKLHNENRFNATYQLLGKVEIIQTLLPRMKAVNVVIYIWKILEGLVLNIRIENYANSRTGSHCRKPKIPPSPSKYRTKYCNNLNFKGPQHFNIPPKCLRDLYCVDVGRLQNKNWIFSCQGFYINLPHERKHK